MSTARPLVRDPGAWLVIAGAFALWLAGWPRAHIDDLFFTGTAIHLAQGGGYTNPWLASWLQSFDTVKNYAQPTFLPYALAAWLKVFGIGAASLTAFHMLMQGALGPTVYHAARKSGAAIWVGLGAVAILWLSLIRYGMRPDAMALLLVTASALLAAKAGAPAGRLALSGLLGAAAVATQPFALCLVVPCHLVLLLKAPRPAVHACSIGGGILAALLLFHLSINGEWREFARVFTTHSASATPGLSSAWSGLLGQIRLGFEPWRLLPPLVAVLAVLVCCARGRRRWSHAWWTWLGMGLLGFCLYSSFMLHYLVQGGIILALLTLAAEARRLACLAMLAHGLCWLNAGVWIQALAPAPALPAPASLRAEIERRSPGFLLLDATAMRRLYDFRPPGRVEDFVHFRPNGERRPTTPADLKQGTVACATAHHFAIKTRDFGVEAPYAALHGRTFRSLPATPEPLIVWPLAP